MIDKELLTNLSVFDETQSNFDELVENLDVLEKVQAKIHSLLITARMKKLMSDFGEKETDIYVVSFPRSGTTLMQMILYQMTTDGNMSFNHIYDVSPWCRFSAFFNRDMPSVGERRIIKSHDSYSMLAHVKKGKFIFMIRDCLDAISSVYQQALDYVNPSADFNELSRRNIERWFEFNNEWITNKNGHDILYVHYEDLITDKESTVRNISKFIEVEIDESVLQRILDRTSMEFMKKREHKFGEQPEHWKVYNNFIRNGRIGEGKAKFTEEQISDLKVFTDKYKMEGTPFARYLKR
jgi:hypothetical protein